VRLVAPLLRLGHHREGRHRGRGIVGADLLDVRATVREGETVLKDYTTGAGTTGAFAGLDQVSRFEKLATAVAERVVKQL